LGAGILEQVVGEVHKNVLKTMLCSYFTKNNRLSLYLLILSLSDFLSILELFLNKVDISIKTLESFSRGCLQIV